MNTRKAERKRKIEEIGKEGKEESDVQSQEGIEMGSG